MRKVNSSEPEATADINADWIKKVQGGKFQREEQAIQEQIRKEYAKEKALKNSAKEAISPEANGKKDEGGL